MKVVRLSALRTGLLYPLVSFYEVLAAGGGDVYEPSYFRMFQLSPLVVFERSLAAKGGNT